MTNSERAGFSLARQLEREGRGREDTRSVMGNMAASKCGAILGEDGLYGWGDPRCGETHGRLVLLYLAVIVRDGSCMDVLTGIENPITGSITDLSGDLPFCF